MQPYLQTCVRGVSGSERGRLRLIVERERAMRRAATDEAETPLSLDAYLEGASLDGLSREQLLELQDAATSDMLDVLDRCRGVGDISRLVPDDEGELAFDSGVIVTEVESDRQPNWRVASRHYGGDMGAWASDQDHAVLIEEFAPAQPTQQLPRRDGAAGEYYMALAALVEQLHDRLGALEGSYDQLPDDTGELQAPPVWRPREVDPVPTNIGTLTHYVVRDPEGRKLPEVVEARRQRRLPKGRGRPAQVLRYIEYFLRLYSKPRSYERPFQVDLPDRNPYIDVPVSRENTTRWTPNWGREDDLPIDGLPVRYDAWSASKRPEEDVASVPTSQLVVPDVHRPARNGRPTEVLAFIARVMAVAGPHPSITSFRRNTTFIAARTLRHARPADVLRYIERVDALLAS
jgi:hypothetical protein